MPWFAAVSNLCRVLAAFCAIAPAAHAAARPQYGGVLRVELRAPAVNLHPARWKSGSPDFATNQRLGELLFDRLVALDNYGRFQPQLATEWSHDEGARKWQFTLRPGVRFTDGSPLTPLDVVAALRAVLPPGMQAAAAAGGVAIQSNRPAGDLLELLASGPFFVYKDSGGAVPRGTGPFVLESVSASARDLEKAGEVMPFQTQRLSFRYNENCWSGRPYLDAIEVTLGIPASRALLDLELGKADLGELSTETARRARQTNLKSWASLPLTLYLLSIPADGKSETGQRLREAIRLSVDRGAMAGVLLQKQAEPAASFLPQWLSGYAFLFDTESNLERAKELRGELPASMAGATQPLRVAVEPGNDLARLVAERVAVDARRAGLTLQTVKGGAHAASDGMLPKNDNGAQLIAFRYTSLSPRSVLESLSGAVRWQSPAGTPPEPAEARYAWEKQMMERTSLLPLVGVPDFAAADLSVRNWSPSPWGEWRLADVWLERNEASRGSSGLAAKPAAGARQ
ncbi:MAG TPA: ABC transporter substrate-binding protein [Candidatus Acidoferrum sp.]|nr:ABC transporter substrate-binding protein [Candidatus Acidoferrum sp.]